MTQAILNSDATALPKQPWLASVKWDCTLIIAPAIVTSVIALACKPLLDNSQFMPLWAWVTFVLVVDVALELSVEVRLDDGLVVRLVGTGRDDDE